MRNTAMLSDDVARQRVVFIILGDGKSVSLVKILHLQACREYPLVVANLFFDQLLNIVFILNIAKYLLQDILQRDNSRRAAKLIYYDSNARLTLCEGLEHGLQRHGLGHVDGLDEDMTVITFDGKKMNDWSEISRLVDDFSSALEVFSDWGRFDLMVLGDELRSFPLGTEQQDVDTFISTVVMATQAKCDENIRRLITSGLDGVNHSLAMSAVNFGLRNAHQYSYLEEHGFEHLQSLKNAYDSILKSPDVNSALNEFISRNQNSQKRTNLIRNTL